MTRSSENTKPLVRSFLLMLEDLIPSHFYCVMKECDDLQDRHSTSYPFRQVRREEGTPEANLAPQITTFVPKTSLSPYMTDNVHKIRCKKPGCCEICCHQNHSIVVLLAKPHVQPVELPGGFYSIPEIPRCLGSADVRLSFLLLSP